VIDILGQLGEAIGTWLRGAAADLFAPAVDTAGRLLFQTPAVGAIPAVGGAWAIVRDIADALFVLAFAVIGVLVMAAGSYDARYTAKRLLPRVAVAAVLVNGSLSICAVLIDLNNMVVAGLIGTAPGPALAGQVATLVGQDGGATALLGLLTLIAAAVFALLLIVVAIGRDLLLVVLTALAPLFLAAAAIPQIEDLARLWWRVFTALVFVQVLQAALVAISVALLVNTDWLGASGSSVIAGLSLIAVLYLLIRLPFLAYRWALERPITQTVSLRVAIAAARGLVG
jgi:hypothetical protein